jgi:hypothetical protein
MIGFFHYISNNIVFPLKRCAFCITHLLACKHLNLPQIISRKKTPRNNQGINYNVFLWLYPKKGHTTYIVLQKKKLLQVYRLIIIKAKKKHARSNSQHSSVNWSQFFFSPKGGVPLSYKWYIYTIWINIFNFQV